MMELGFYVASTCFATQIVPINLLNKRTLSAKLEKTLTYILTEIDDYAKDGGEELFTKMHCVRITNTQRFHRNSIKECSASW